MLQIFDSVVFAVSEHVKYVLFDSKKGILNVQPISRTVNTGRCGNCILVMSGNSAELSVLIILVSLLT